MPSVRRRGGGWEGGEGGSSPLPALLRPCKSHFPPIHSVRLPLIDRRKLEIGLAESSRTSTGLKKYKCCVVT